MTKKRVSQPVDLKGILDDTFKSLGLELPSAFAEYEALSQSEWEKCSSSPVYFIEKYCFIEDPVTRNWIHFNLWKEQEEVIEIIEKNKKTIILKARQLGMTWCCLCYALWEMLFSPIATILLFSKRDDEATVLRERLRGIYVNLEPWLKERCLMVTDSQHILRFSNGSVARAFPTNAGDSYSATLAIVDEADLVPDLNDLLRRASPTINAGGKIVLVSRVDKSAPNSHFKQIYRAAKDNKNGYIPIFLPWNVHPDRTQEWYENEVQESIANSGSKDDVWEQYPATDIEALAPKVLDKRLPFEWLQLCYEEMKPLSLDLLKEIEDCPIIPKMEVYRLPVEGHSYHLGADPAEGNPTSDDSSLTVLDDSNGEEVCSLASKIEPSIFSLYIHKIGTFYNKAKVLPERNNHGHAVIMWLKEHSDLEILEGHDKKPGRETKLGWMSSTTGKFLMYDAVADGLKEGGLLIHSFQTFTQLASIEGSTLLAPEGDHDDRADSFALASVALRTYRQLNAQWDVMTGLWRDAAPKDYAKGQPGSHPIFSAPLPEGSKLGIWRGVGEKSRPNQ